MGFGQFADLRWGARWKRGGGFFEEGWMPQSRLSVFAHRHKFLTWIIKLLFIFSLVIYWLKPPSWFLHLLISSIFSFPNNVFLLCLPLEVFLFLFSIFCFCWHLYGTSLAVIFHLPWFGKMIHIRFHVILMKSTAVDMKCISLCNDFQWNNSHRIILLVFFKDTHLYMKNILVFTLK